ncbi:glucan biosynthesis protein G [Jannaschia sp. Os4]|uniref:glucan biosynthesis protein n=1 Tax=Jannaschia sp. Os4 TaxID=2807617 RepID=UPI00193A2E60|nr:glucan biosynthesis protein G [Jannaschia sp. Os4]MBM2576573.1 glucan biosynthesis protein G [Jannaschia sp. Os4]
MRRRDFLAVVAAAGAAPTLARAAPGEGEPFDAGLPERVARDLAERPFEPAPLIPQAWRDMTYDEYRTLWFDGRHALWTGEDTPFRVDFFHPGLYFPRPVAVSAVRDGVAVPVPFELDWFDRTDMAPDLPVDETLGYSGLRLRGPLDRPDIPTEFAVFQGASYFRGHGQGQVYGLSARGLALRTADEGGEEFPEFTRFWLEPGEGHVVVHALLDGPSTAGAYRIKVTPGEATEMEVEAVLFPRVDLDHVGIAPLTSMFLYDATDRTRFDDFRPAVHDSDGLLVWNGMGELLWRPLKNPRTLQISAFVDEDPKGFGLMQRASRLGEFNDLEADYHRRPSLWVEPGEGWGTGHVRLVEIPADQEIYDNVVAYWRPRAVIPAGGEHRMTYRLSWGGEPATREVAHVRDTAMGLTFAGDRRLAVIDFADHPALAGDLSDVTVHVSSNRAEVSEGVLQRNPETGGARLAFSFDPGTRNAVELRAQLLRGGEAASEVWLYRWTT